MKTCQESLPALVPDVDGINFSDGEYSILSPASVFTSLGPIEKLYAVRHDPFAHTVWSSTCHGPVVRTF
jgi:hypothetical protein